MVRRKLQKLTGRNVTCSHCGKPKYKELSKIKKDNYCNTTCYHAWLRSDKNPYKTRKHTEEEKEKIRQANLKRDYSKILTSESRRKMAESARNKIWTPEAREKLSKANLGKKLSEEHKRKIKANGKYAQDNIMWNEFTCSYEALHMWVYRHKEYASICIDCGITRDKATIQWSNQSGWYFRDLNDFVGRCIPCHRKYDKKLGYAKKRCFDEQGRRIGIMLIVPPDYLDSQYYR